MHYALVRDGLVVDIIVADAAFIAKCGDEVASQRGGGSWVEAANECGVGKFYYAGAFHDMPEGG